ncbi:MAG: hypothetical protein ACE3L7_02040 [Candidatus Pristimantibacillus sp.]
MSVMNIINQTSPYILTLVTGAVGGQFINHYILGKRERNKLTEQQRRKFYVPVYNLMKIYLERNTAQKAEDELKNITNYQMRKEVLDFIENNFDNAGDEVIEAFHIMKSSRYLLRQTKIQDTEIVHIFFYKILRSYYEIAILNKNEIKVNILFFQLFRLVKRLNLKGYFNEISYSKVFDQKKLLKLYSFEDFEIVLLEEDNKGMENFLKGFIERVSFSDPKHVWDRFNSYQDNHMNKNFLEVYRIKNDAKDISDKPLSIYNRQYFRKKLLFDLYINYFKNDIEYTVSSYNNLHREKRLAFDFYEEKGLINIKTIDDRVLIKLTEQAIEKVEEQEITIIASKDKK